MEWVQGVAGEMEMNDGQCCESYECRFSKIKKNCLEISRSFDFSDRSGLR